jgi:hypothetical protein
MLFQPLLEPLRAALAPRALSCSSDRTNFPIRLAPSERSQLAHIGICLDVFSKDYGLARSEVFKDVALADARHALQSNEISALLVVIPLSQKYLSLVLGLFQEGPKTLPVLISIASAGAIAETNVLTRASMCQKARELHLFRRRSHDAEDCTISGGKQAQPRSDDQSDRDDLPANLGLAQAATVELLTIDVKIDRAIGL